MTATGLLDGVLVVQGGVTVIDSSTFTGNRAANGGVANVSAGVLTMFNTLIDSNLAEGSGGAIYASGSASVLLGEKVVRASVARVSVAGHFFAAATCFVPLLYPLPQLLRAQTLLAGNVAVGGGSAGATIFVQDQAIVSYALPAPLGYVTACAFESYALSAGSEGTCTTFVAYSDARDR